MEYQKFLFLFKKYLKHLLIWPVVVGVAVFLLSLNDPKTYESKALIYAGFTSGYNIENLSSSARTDYRYAENSFDNLVYIIKSRNTLELVSLRLLVSHLKFKGNNPEVISDKLHAQIMERIPNYIKNKSNQLSEEQLLNYFVSSLRESDTSWVNNLLNSGSAYYSLWALSNVTVSRLKESDLVELRFSSSDPGVAKATLDILISVFVNNFKSIRSDQLGNASQYFDAKIGQLSRELKEKEDSLLRYKQYYNIVNYEGQSAQMTEKKDMYEQMYLECSIQYESAKSALEKIEGEIQGKSISISNNYAISDLRGQVSEISSQIMREQLKGSAANSEKIKQLEQTQKEVNIKLKNSVSQLETSNSMYNGVSNSVLIQEWLDKIISFEEVKAKLKVITDNAKTFGIQFKNYAPIGIGLKRIERDIAVLEEEYRSVTEAYNQSKLKEQNLERSLNIVALDPPFYPLKANKSSSIFKTILGVFAGVFAVLLVIFVKEIIFTRVSTIDVAKRLISDEIVGIYPFIAGNIKYGKSIQRAENLIVQKLLTEFKNAGKESYNVLILSFHDSDGKTYIASLLKDYIQSEGVVNSTFTEYDIDTKAPQPSSEKGIHFHKILPLTEKIYNPIVTDKFDCTLLVVNAGMKWTLLESDLINAFKSSFKGKILLLLNNVDPLYFKTLFK